MSRDGRFEGRFAEIALHELGGPISLARGRGKTVVVGSSISSPRRQIKNTRLFFFRGESSRMFSNAG